MGTRYLLFGVLIPAMLGMPVFGEDADNVAAQIGKLKSHYQNEIAKAASAIKKQRTETIKGLIEIVEKKIDPIAPMGTMETAVRLLGTLRAKEAIPVLLKNIDFQPRVEDECRGDVRPCVDALIEIGNPAAQAILEKYLAVSTKAKFPYYLKVLKGVWGRKICLFLLKEKLKTKLTPQQKANLQAALNDPIFKEEMTFVDKCAEQEKMLKQNLADNALWTDANMKKELLDCLNMACALRARLTASILAGRIEYNPYPDREEKRRLTSAMVYPAYKALKSIGIPAIPHLLAELKKTNPKESEESRLKHVLLTSCVWEIYDQGGHGLALAKKRLELELAATKDAKEKANLQAALNDPIFKEEKDAKKK